MPLKRHFAQRAIGWLVFAAGLSIGLCCLVQFGRTELYAPFGPDLLGLVFLIASLIALHNPRRAGLVLLASAPIVTFTLAYPSAGFWEKGAYIVPSPAVGLVLTAIFFAPFIVVLPAIHKNRKRAAWLLVILASLAGFAFGFSPWTKVLLPPLAAWATLLLGFGSFWLGTSNLGWSALIRANRPSWRRKLAMVLIECLLIAVVDLGATLVLTAKESSIWRGDCSGTPAFVRPLHPGQAVFTARIIRAGHIAKVSGKWAGNWAIGRIEKRFWGFSFCSPNWVLLTDHAFLEHETFFVAGYPAPGLLTRLLPIVDTGPCSGVAARLADAEIELRLQQRDESAANRVSVIGYVRSPRRISELPALAHPVEGYEWAFNRPPAYKALGGVRIRVTGSSGTTIVTTTDPQGIYELDDLPADDYALRVLYVPDHQISLDRKLKRDDLLRVKPIHLHLYLDWAGTLEGRISDSGGNPAPVSLELLNPDRTAIDPRVLQRWGQVDRNGSFQFSQIPVGERFLVLINPFGPSDDSPYDPRYYPSASRPNEARIFESGSPGDHIRNVDFTLNRLKKRDLHVRVTTPNGQPVDDATIHVSYENTPAFDDLAAPPQAHATDRNGVSEIHVFGDRRIRVRAQKLVPDGARYSGVVELEAARLPPKLDLIVPVP